MPIVITFEQASPELRQMFHDDQERSKALADKLSLLVDEEKTPLLVMQMALVMMLVTSVHQMGERHGEGMVRKILAGVMLSLCAALDSPCCEQRLGCAMSSVACTHTPDEAIAAAAAVISAQMMAKSDGGKDITAFYKAVEEAKREVERESFAVVERNTQDDHKKS
jgi:hypothetical protein